MYLWSSGYFRRVEPFIDPVREVRAERAVLMEEYSAPAWKFNVKNLSTKFIGR